MKTQLTTIQVDQTSALIIETLKEKAKARGVTLDVLLQKFAEGLDKGRDGMLTFAETRKGEPSQDGMSAVLRRSAERLKRMPFSGSTEESLNILHEGRSGEMYGYGPVK